MDPSGASLFRHRKPSNSDLLLGLSSSHTTTATDNDLNEDDVFWTADFAAQSPNHHHHHQRHPSTSANRTTSSPLSKGFERPEIFGILAALPEDDPSSRALQPHPIFHHHKAPASSSSSSSSSSSTSSSRMMIPTIPRPPIERQALTSSSELHHQSAPVNVPVRPSKAMLWLREFAGIEDDDDEEEEVGEMLRPHELVARSYAQAPMLACSVLEGVGRTLKGRDLRQVRNSVWRRTGFLN